MKPHKKPLTEKQFQDLHALPEWKVFDIPINHWNILGGHRKEDTIAVMGSADCYDPKLLNEINAIAGLDQLVCEANPHPGELEGNAYHFVIQKTSRSDYPYILYGPFCSETRVKHWFVTGDIDIYFKG